MRVTTISLRNRSAGLAGLCALVFAALLAGCASSSGGGVQVDDRTHGRPTTPARQPVTKGGYVVQRGDTLYSIAFRFGWDWKELARRNDIPPPYVIRPGQSIRFESAARSGTAPVATQTATVSPPLVVNQPPPVAKPPVTGQSSQTSPAAKPPITTAPVSVPAVTRSDKGWAWPASGPLVGRFSSNGSLNKGIDIGGELGQPVLAASDGTVVYAGSGLRGYGELVIIKHSDTYVSAYGHNRRLLVREGQQVKAGQTIAEMGSTGTDRVKLHFEIRRQGKPVDPMQYLPNR